MAGVRPKKYLIISGTSFRVGVPSGQGHTLEFQFFLGSKSAQGLAV